MLGREVEEGVSGLTVSGQLRWSEMKRMCVD